MCFEFPSVNESEKLSSDWVSKYSKNSISLHLKHCRIIFIIIPTLEKKSSPIPGQLPYLFSKLFLNCDLLFLSKLQRILAEFYIFLL